MLLMIVLGWRKSLIRDYIGENRPADLFLKPGLRLFGKSALLVRVKEDNGRVLARPAPARRIMAGPENIEQLGIAYRCRVVVDLYGLAMVS
jgi:hypothetical protein